jgi:two-component system LytT family response regulator
MVKVLIVEDEKNVAEGLHKMLDILSLSTSVVGIADSVSAAVLFLEANEVDLVFLDIKLPDGNGMDLLTKVNAENFAVIFTTAYSEYAIKAFRFNAVDYLLKPLDPAKLREATSRAIERIKEQNNFRKFLDYNDSNKNQTIRLSTVDRHYEVLVRDIFYLKAEGAYTQFFVDGLVLLVSKNIGYYQELLDSFKFARCHQSYLVNVDHIISHSSKELVLSDKSIVPISTRKLAIVRELLNHN